MPTDVEIAIAETHMQRIVGDLERLERHKENMLIEYFGWQSLARPFDECDHAASSFCCACGNNS
jgi:hypothetical protein